MPCVAPSAFTRWSLLFELDTTMTDAPCAAANWTANNATPPVPCTTTVSPARIFASSTSANHAVSPATDSVLAAAASSMAGARTSRSSGTVTYSASRPGKGAVLVPTSGAGPSIQWRMSTLMTLSPTAKRVTPAPTASTSPAISEPGNCTPVHLPRLPSSIARSR